MPIRSESDQVEGRRILVGESSATRQFGLRGADFRPQEYLIAFRTNTRHPDRPGLGGHGGEPEGRGPPHDRRDAPGDCGTRWTTGRRSAALIGAAGEMELPGLYDDQGTCLAAYDFLERFCGVRWYGPAELNIVIPPRKTLAAAGDDVRRSPALKHRGAHARRQLAVPARAVGRFHSGPGPSLLAADSPGRRSAGRATTRSTAAPSRRCSTTPNTNPGTRKSQGSQLCYTHPKLINQVAQMARDYFDGKGALPEGWKALGDYFAIVPDDNMNLCNCAACAALLQKGRDAQDRVLQQRRDERLLVLLRQCRRARGAPDASGQVHRHAGLLGLRRCRRASTLEPNVSVAPCLHTCYYPVHAEMRENDLKFYREWREKAQRPCFSGSITIIPWSRP